MRMYSFERLVYLGDAKFGVLVSRTGLSQSEKTSTTAVRLALSVLELLLTKEECQTLSVYGRNKHKTAMDEKKTCFKMWERNDGVLGLFSAHCLG